MSSNAFDQLVRDEIKKAEQIEQARREFLDSCEADSAYRAKQRALREQFDRESN